jgi:hypothetical protein
VTRNLGAHLHHLGSDCQKLESKSPIEQGCLALGWRCVGSSKADAGEGAAAPERKLSDDSAYDDLSQGSVRLGQAGSLDTYSFAAACSIGRTRSVIGAIQPDAISHRVPSHCWT